VKVDDISRPYHRAEVEAIRKAIDRTIDRNDYSSHSTGWFGLHWP